MTLETMIEIGLMSVTFATLAWLLVRTLEVQAAFRRELTGDEWERRIR